MLLTAFPRLPLPTLGRRALCLLPWAGALVPLLLLALPPAASLLRLQAIDLGHPSALQALSAAQSLLMIWTLRRRGPGGAAAQLAVREDERRRIARELHDDLGQLLTLLRLRAALPRPAPRELRRLADQCLRALRERVFQLRPVALEGGLAPALRRLAADFAHHAGPGRRYDCAAEPLAGLDDATALQLFRIAQEALSNATRHARARRVALTLRRDGDGRLCLRIEDDGAGFAPDSAAGRGQGLRTLRERARLLGGRLRIDSAPGRGTRIELRCRAGAAVAEAA